MSEKYQPKKGDRVRVVFEGDVIYAEGREFETADFYVRNTDKEVVSVEKIEPPVTVFKPGQVVKRKTFDYALRALGRDGYVHLATGRYYQYSDFKNGAYAREDFTSRDYELVSLG